jgi:hypothetical protein
MYWLSGAAVICDGLVVAIQHSHQMPDRPESLEAELLSKFINDENFCRLLKMHGVPLVFPEVYIPESTRGEEPLQFKETYNGYTTSSTSWWCSCYTQ